MTVDGTAPLPAAVTIHGATDADSGGSDGGDGSSMRCQKSTSTLKVSWQPFDDPESGVVEYRYCVSSSDAGDCDTRAFVSVGKVRSARASGLKLVSGQTYFVTVMATNGAGLTSRSISAAGITVVTAAPIIGKVFDGNSPTGIDQEFTSDTAAVSARWSLARGTGTIVRSYWSIGTSPQGMQVQQFTDVGLTLEGMRAGLSLRAGRYYHSVYVEDCVGELQSCTSSLLKEVESLTVKVEGFRQKKKVP